MLMQCMAEPPHIVSVFSHEVVFFMFTLNINMATFPCKQTTAFLINFFQYILLCHYKEITPL